MADRIKERLDADWHDLLDTLNQQYEEAYAEMMTLAPRLGAVQRLTLVAVSWAPAGETHVALGAIIEGEGNQDA